MADWCFDAELPRRVVTRGLRSLKCHALAFEARK